MTPEIRMVTKKIVITHRIILLRSLLELAGSVFDTVNIPFIYYKKTAADRINLTA